MTQADRDRLVALKKAASGAITQRQAAEELKLSERQERGLLAKLRGRGDQAIHSGWRVCGSFVGHESMEENMAVVEQYLGRYGRPLEFYTDKASIFYTTPKKNHAAREQPLPPTQIGRALAELNIGWIAAHSPQAKGRIERSFNTAQDRLVKGMRVAGVKTIEEANAYLESEYLPEWNAKFTVVPPSADNAHRPLRKQGRLEAILCRVEQRVGGKGYTRRLDGETFQIAPPDILPRLCGS